MLEMIGYGEFRSLESGLKYSQLKFDLVEKYPKKTMVPYRKYKDRVDERFEEKNWILIVNILVTGH